MTLGFKLGSLSLLSLYANPVDKVVWSSPSKAYSYTLPLSANKYFFIGYVVLATDL